jgi:dihydropteroate synthase
VVRQRIYEILVIMDGKGEEKWTMKSRPITIMGVLNVTPDSFSDGGLYFENVGAAVVHAEHMARNGAGIIDIGGESGRPRAAAISWSEELRRILPVIIAVRRTLGSDIRLSVDTRHAETAAESVAAGVDIINCAGALHFDDRVANVAAQANCQLILFDLPVNPSTMLATRDMSGDRVLNIKSFLRDKIEYSISVGVSRSRILVDPGLGYWHSLEQNLDIVRRLDEIAELGFPLVLGASRKSHLAQLTQAALKLQDTPGPVDRVDAELAEIGWAIQKGAQVIRTHEVARVATFCHVMQRLYNL